MYDETSADEKWKWRVCRAFELAVDDEKNWVGALRKHPNTAWWYYHAPMIQDLAPHAPWARNSLSIGRTQKVVAECMTVFVGWEKIPKNADKSWNEWKRYGKQHTIKTEHTPLDVTATTIRWTSSLPNCQGCFHPALWQDYGSLINVKHK